MTVVVVKDLLRRAKRMICAFGDVLTWRTLGQPQGKGLLTLPSSPSPPQETPLSVSSQSRHRLIEAPACPYCTFHTNRLHTLPVALILHTSNEVGNTIAIDNLSTRHAALTLWQTKKKTSALYHCKNGGYIRIGK